MKKTFISLLVIFVLFGLSGCENRNVTSLGGTKEIVLPENMKFMNYNFEDLDNIWVTYRPMRESEKAETYIIQQDKGGIHMMGDGKFIIYEVKDGVKSPKIKE